MYRLLEALPPEIVVTDPDLIEGYRRDRSPAPAGRPSAVLQPRSTSEVALILSHATRSGVRVVPRGAGTGLAGGATATDGCVVLSLGKMDRILELDARNAIAVVQPGVLNGALKRAAHEHGLTYVPDPSSYEICSIGGNLSTNAGGLRCMSLGITREHVLALEVVLPSGKAMRVGGRTFKRRAGYDLISLFVGSEGTLGVITEATLRLEPSIPVGAVALATFGSIEAAGRAVVALAASRLPIMALELMDDVTVAAVEAFKPVGLDATAAATILIELGNAGPTTIALVGETCGPEVRSEVLYAETPQECEWLMAGRRSAIPALEAKGATIVDDVIVPRERIPEICASTREASLRHGVLVAMFGHAGDGNFHPTIVFERGEEGLGRALAAADDVMRAAIELGGSITGEHGVGMLKRHLVQEEIDPEALALMRAIKALVDPANILNPGKVL